MKKIYYEKRGRRYVPVSEYDSEYLDSFSRGTHLVMCYPGGQSRRYNVDPNYAAMIAAGRVAEDAMSRAISKVSELRPQRTPLTPGQQRAWRKLAKEFGDELATLSINSARDIAEAGVNAQMEEAAKLMTHPAVQEAYNKFLLVCEITRNSSKT
jgi:ribosomal protein S11